MIADFLADAKRVTSGPYAEIRVCKDYSYIRKVLAAGTGARG